MSNTPVAPSKIADSSELAIVLSSNDKTIRGLLDFARQFKVSALLGPFSLVKAKGMSLSNLLLLLCIVRLQGDSIYSQASKGFGGLFEGDKNVFYRFLNNGLMDWRKLLLSFAKQFARTIRQNAEDAGTGAIRCFVIDDTTLEKTGKTIECIGRVFDHVQRKMVLGFKMLLLGYWDGKSFISIDCTLHREKGNVQEKPYGMTKKELRKQFSKKRTADQPSCTRRKELDKGKLEMLLEMVKRAVKHGFAAEYVLVDSWFMCEELILGVRAIRKGIMHVLGMARVDRRKYAYHGKEQTAPELIARYSRRNSKYSRKHKIQYFVLVASYKGIPVKMFFTRFGNHDKWHLIITTNLTVNFIQAIEIYQLRWAIEVTFKECKQYLGLGKCQGTDLDGQIADCTMALITHTILSLEKRFSTYETMGGLYKSLREELTELTLWQRLWKLFLQLVNELGMVLSINVEEVMQKMIADSTLSKRIYAILQVMQSDEGNLRKAA